MRIIYAIPLVTGLLSYPAFAGQTNGGMQHFTVAKPKTYVTPNADTQKTDLNETEQAVWERYKAIAAGIPAQTEEQKPKQPAQKVEQAETAAPKTGLTGIIEQYRNNRKQQKQLRTLTIHQPETKTLKDTSQAQ